MSGSNRTFEPDVGTGRWNRARGRKGAGRCGWNRSFGLDVTTGRPNLPKPFALLPEPFYLNPPPLLLINEQLYARGGAS